MSTCVDIVITAIVALHPSWDETKAKKYADPICVEAERRDIDPLIVVALINHESGFNKRIVYKNKNGSADYGLTQFNCRKMSRIKLGWRRWWCHQKRRKYLMTVEGNIKAGFRELLFWKETCSKIHKDRNFLFRWKNQGDHIFCRDCFSVATVASSPDIYKNLASYWRLIDVLKRHWWVRHYNWHSKKHWKSILFTYNVLLLRDEETYKLVTSGYYRSLARRGKLKKCLKKDDLCLKEYKEWQEKRSLRRKSKRSRRK